LKAAAAAGLAGWSRRVFAQARQAADLVFLGGVVVTLNPAQPIAEAVAVRQGRILTVGSRQEVEAVCDARTKRIALTGKCLSPGLIDAHSHLIGFGQMELFYVSLRPPKVHDLESLRRTLADAAARKPRGEWIVGRDQAFSMVPLASFRRAGVKLSFGADVPAFPSHRPLDSIRCAMARRTATEVPLDSAEQISFLEALEAHTVAAAWAGFDERELGTIEADKYADFAVWNRDLRAIRTARDLDRLQVVATYLAGEPTHQA
jgi:predicted amidohydrolase YtcJ